VHDRPEWLPETHGVLAAVGERVVRPVVGDRGLAGQHLADDPHDLAGARERLAERLAVPALDDLRAADAHAEDDAAAGEVVERQHVHGDGRGRAPRQLHDGGAELDPGGLPPPPGQRRERVAIKA
jgi:hypothetical protein